MKGAGCEGQDSREGFPLGRTAESLPTRTQQVPDPIPALSVAPERGGGWSCCVSLCQPGAEINALSRSLGFREQGRAGSDPAREGPGLGRKAKLDLPGAPYTHTHTRHTHTPFQFINLEGLPPVRVWARPYLFLEKVRPHQRRPPTPLGSRPHLLLSIPLSLEELSPARTQLTLSPSVSTVRVGPGSAVCLLQLLFFLLLLLTALVLVAASQILVA